MTDWLNLLLIPAALVVTFVLIELWHDWDRKRQGLMSNKEWRAHRRKWKQANQSGVRDDMARTPHSD